MTFRTPLIVALAVALLPSTALAQAWIGSPDFSEGIGIRAGNAELHPSVGAEFGYDSNFFRTSGRGPGENVVDVLKLRVTPSLTLTSLGSERRGTTVPPSVVFSAGGYASYFEVFPLDSGATDASKRRNVAIGADANANIFPRGRVGVDLLASFRRVIDTEGSTNDLAGDGFNRDTLRAGGGLTWRPGGGLFEWRAGYTALYHFFENGGYKSYDNLHHEFGTRGRWRFFPRSALLFDSTYTLVRYTRDTTQTNGDAINSRIGLHGLITYHLAVLTMVGWAASFYRDHAGSIAPRQYDSPVADAEVRWFIQPRPDLDSTSLTSGLSSIALGYSRTFRNSYQGSFYQRDRGYLNLSMFLVGAVASGLEFGVSRVAYPADGTNSSASQLRLDGRFFGEYRFTDTLAANATVQYDRVNSDRIAGEDLDYKRWQAFLGVRWFM